MDILSGDLHAMRNLLKNDSDCTDWLAGVVGKDRFQSAMRRVDDFFKIADAILDPNRIEPDGRKHVVAATTADFPEWPGIVVNYGYYHSAAAGEKMRILIHELAHHFNAKDFIAFDYNNNAQDANRQLLLKYCSKTVGAN